MISVYLPPSYACIFYTVRESIETMKEQSTSTVDEHALAMKLAVVVVTDFICWVRTAFLTTTT